VAELKYNWIDTLVPARPRPPRLHRRGRIEVFGNSGRDYVLRRVLHGSTAVAELK